MSLGDLALKRRRVNAVGGVTACWSARSEYIRSHLVTWYDVSGGGPGDGFSMTAYLTRDCDGAAADAMERLKKFLAAHL
jgi:hypothetical protein